MSGGYAVDQQQLQEFRLRLKRIEGQAGAKAREAREIRRLRQRRRAPKAGLLSHLMALVSGAAAVVAARLVRAIYFDADLTGADAAAAMLNDAALALAAAFMVKALMRFNFRQFALLQVAGIALMIVGMHNLVHLAPDAFARVFPTQWVDHVLAATEPRSLLIQGQTIVF